VIRVARMEKLKRLTKIRKRDLRKYAKETYESTQKRTTTVRQKDLRKCAKETYESTPKRPTER